MRWTLRCFRGCAQVMLIVRAVVPSPSPCQISSTVHLTRLPPVPADPRNGVWLSGCRLLGLGVCLCLAGGRVQSECRRALCWGDRIGEGVGNDLPMRNGYLIPARRGEIRIFGSVLFGLRGWGRRFVRVEVQRSRSFRFSRGGFCALLRRGRRLSRCGIGRWGCLLGYGR